MESILIKIQQEKHGFVIVCLPCEDTMIKMKEGRI